MMRRRDLLKLAVSGAAIAPLLAGTRKKFNASPSTAQVTVDWSTARAQTTPFVFGSNDYEITIPEKAADRVYQNRLAQLGIGLIRIHHAGLCDRWSNAQTQSWDAAKIKACFDVSYPQKPTIIQNIPGWPQWMKHNQDGLLDPAEYDNYAAFCAELVEILNRRQQRQIVYWEPLNEQDVRYQKAGKLDELWTIYNKVAKAMKAKDPRIKVGGPAQTWDEPIRLGAFLQACKPHVDFISWHRYGSGDAQESNDTILSYTPQYAHQVRQFRKLAAQYIPERKVPLLLGEYNINYSWQSGENRQNTHIGAVWFASVLKHLSDAGIDMATSWHLKDGVYGLIDPQNNLRPAATVFAWGIQYLTGTIVDVKSDHAFVEAMAVRQKDGKRSLLLINKSAEPTRLVIQAKPHLSTRERIPLLYLDANGIRNMTLAATALKQEPLILNPYSLSLLRLN